MATWDFGGGCACGVSKYCDCAHGKQRDGTTAIMARRQTNITTHKGPKRQMVKKDVEDDFGFTAVSEQELITTPQVNTHNAALLGLRDMIMPLLNKLSENADKEIIKWPNRAQAIDKFKARMDKYIEDHKL